MDLPFSPPALPFSSPEKVAPPWNRTPSPGASEASLTRLTVRQGELGLVPGLESEPDGET